MMTGLKWQDQKGAGDRAGHPALPSLRLQGPSAAAEIRRLKYFLGLLDLGFSNAAATHHGAECPRGERIALGIDHPELDAVPFWSSRRDDGGIAIPFIEFILSEIRMSLDRLGAENCGDRSGTFLDTGRRIVDGLLERIGDGSGAAWKNPRPGDRYLPEGLLRPLCGPGSLLLPIVEHCEESVQGGPG